MLSTNRKGPISMKSNAFSVGYFKAGICLALAATVFSIAPCAQAQVIRLSYKINLINGTANGKFANRTGMLKIYSAPAGSTNPYEVDFDTSQDANAGSARYVTHKKLLSAPYNQNIQVANVQYIAKYNDPKVWFNGYPIITVKHINRGAGFDSINSSFFTANPDYAELLGGIRFIQDGSIVFVFSKDFKSVLDGFVIWNGTKPTSGATTQYTVEFYSK